MMKISPISLYSFKQNKTGTKQKNSILNDSNYSLPDYRFYQSFLGGYTVNLRETFNNLDREQYPNPDIYYAIEKELSENPDSQKTLHDFHFEKYRGILDCYDLFELAEKYPEFNFVEPAYYVDSKEGSFIDNFKQGKYEFFNNDEDLTLQLIKLYWGQGFSLNDLSKYIADNSSDRKPINLYHTMKKLNIPLMTRKYSAVLKLSNKEYNEKFTSEMSIKLKEAKEARLQLSEGEPVVIPRGELSPAHKQHISEGLRKYFSKHPERIYEMSERQKQFYEENPQKAEELSLVMDYAWNKTQEGKSVARGLSKFLKKTFKINIKETEIYSSFEKIGKSAMSSFWQTNAWAKEQFSQAVIKGWEYIKTQPDKTPQNKDVIISRIYPKELILKIQKWAQQEFGADVPFYGIGRVFLYVSNVPYSKEEAAAIDNITDLYFQVFPQEANDMATSIQLGLLSFVNDLDNNHTKLPKSIRQDKEKIEMLKLIFDSLNEKYPIYNLVVQNGNPLRYPASGVASDVVFDFYCNYIDIACSNECDDIVKYLESKMDDGYFAVKKLNQGYPKYMRNMLGIKIS